jgi:hypothetical protein
MAQAEHKLDAQRAEFDEQRRALARGVPPAAPHATCNAQPAGKGRGGMHHTINTADAACTLRRALCPSEAVRCAPVFRTRERARQSQARPRRSNLKRTQTLAGGRAEGRVLEYSRRVLEYSRRAGGRAGGAPAAVLVA